MASIFTVGAEFLPKGSVDLGRLVAKKASPLEEYYQPPPDIPRTTAEKVDEGGDDYGVRHLDTSASAKFLGYVSLSYSKQKVRLCRVQSNCVKTYLLENSGQYFDQIIKLEDTRKFLERVVKNDGEACLIVGYKTVQDAVITEFDKEFTLTDLKVSVRGTGVKASEKRDDPILRTKKATGEQVCALLLRLVKVKTRKTKFREAQLEGNEWYSLTAYRQAQIPDTEVVLEAEIGESTEPDNFDFDDEEENWTKVEEEDGNYYL